MTAAAHGAPSQVLRYRTVASVVLFLAGSLLLAGAFYFGVTRPYPGANDFYVPWRATRAALFERRNPYDAGVTRDIQLGMFGKTAPPGAHQWGFAYPYYTVLLLAPLALLPYDAAQALWHTLTLILLILSISASVGALRWSLRPVALFALVFALLSTYPVVRAFILGQLAIVVVACVAGAWWAAQRRYDALAGALLALATIKPQMVFLLLPLALWYAAQEKRFGIVRGFVALFAVLALASFALEPGWLADFAGAARAYAGYFDSVTPLDILFGPGLTALFVSALLIASVAVAAAISARHHWASAAVVFAWAIIVSQLVAVHTATPNQMLLLLPVLLAISRLPQIPARILLVVLVLSLLVVIPWLVFFATKTGNAEAPLAILPFGIASTGWWLTVEGVRLISRWQTPEMAV